MYMSGLNRSNAQPIVLGSGPFKIKIVGSRFSEVDCNVLSEESLFKIKKKYARHIGVKYGCVKFIFDGKEVADTSSPKDLKMKDGDVIQVEKVYINIKMVGIKGGGVSLRVAKDTSVEQLERKYLEHIRSPSPILVYKGRVVSYLETALTLNMKNDDFISVNTKYDSIDIAVSFQSEIPNRINYALNYGDSMDDIMREYTERIGTELNSVRFMFDGKRIKTVKSMAKQGIPPNAVIQVFKEYETINLKVVDAGKFANEFQVQVNYDAPFSKLKENSDLFGFEPTAVEFTPAIHYSRVLLDEQTPRDLEMNNNDTIVFHRIGVTDLKFINALDKSTIMDVRVKSRYPLDDTLRKCANIAGVEFESVKFMLRGRRIHPGKTPYSLSMGIDPTIEMHRRVNDIRLKFVGPYDISKQVVLNVTYEGFMESAKKEYAAIVGEDVNNLRFTFGRKMVWDYSTPEFFAEYYDLKEYDTIQVRMEHQPEKYINLKMVGEDSNELIYRTLIDVPLANLKIQYAHIVGEAVVSKRFLFDGLRLNDEDTPRSMNMEENDVIEVFGEQCSGPSYYY